jgi:hypothetical protein
LVLSFVCKSVRYIPGIVRNSIVFFHPNVVQIEWQ